MSLGRPSPGAPAPVVGRGVLLRDGMDVPAIRDYPWLFTSAICIIVMVLSFQVRGTVHETLTEHISRPYKDL